MHRYASRRAQALILVACFVLGMIMAAPASAVTLTTVAEADAFVLSSSPNGNRGHAPALRVRNAVKLTYIRFSVPDAPVGESVTTATLRVFANTPSRCTLGVDVLRAASDTWGESTITWANQPGVMGLVLANAIWTSNGYRSFDVTPGVEPVQPWLESQPVDGQNDVADDAAIWVHPTDPSQSLVLGTDKNDTGVGGLHVFDLAGQKLSKVSHGTRMNGVDVRDGFPLGAQTVPLVSVTNRVTNGIDFFRIDPATQTLTNVGSVTSAVPGAAGLCMYHSSSSGEFFAIVTHGGNGTLEEFELDGSTGTVTAQVARTISAGSTIEGCVADDALGHLYVSQETKGVWRYAAEPTGGSSRTLVDDDSTSGHLVPDVEGLTIWYGPSGTGWLLASSQGESTFAVYSRQPPNTYQGEFDITAAIGIDDTNFTDGIDVTSAALPAPFSGGLFVAHDHSPEGPHASNFKYVGWQDIAAALGL